MVLENAVCTSGLECPKPLLTHIVTRAVCMHLACGASAPMCVCLCCLNYALAFIARIAHKMQPLRRYRAHRPRVMFAGIVPGPSTRASLLPRLKRVCVCVCVPHPNPPTTPEKRRRRSNRITQQIRGTHAIATRAACCTL